MTSLADIGNTSGLYLIGNGLHLEPATIADSTLKNGVYITDTQLRPILVLDAQGYVRYMDTNIVWTALIEGDKTIFIMSRDRAELGRLVIKGDMTTYWSGK